MTSPYGPKTEPNEYEQEQLLRRVGFDAGFAAARSDAGGFTREDVTWLRADAEYLEAHYGDIADRLRGLADRIAPLLPPE